MQPKAIHIAMRQLIRRKANTPEGYCMADATGMPGYAYSSQHTDRMIKTGELVRVKVRGFHLRFVKTQEQADALQADLLAGPKQRIRKPDKRKRTAASPARVPRSGPLRSLVIALSALPTGTSRADCAHLERTKDAFSSCVQLLVKSGLLYRAKVRGHAFRYFASLADAAAWEAVTPVQVLQRKGRPARPSQAVRKPKTEKIARPVKYKPVSIVIRRECSPPPPKAAAVIVWPARMPECRMMPPGRYEASVPRQIMGTASWVTL